MNPQFVFEGKPYVKLDVRVPGPTKFELQKLFRSVHGLEFEPGEFHDPHKFRFLYPRDSNVDGSVFWVVLWNKEGSDCDT